MWTPPKYLVVETEALPEVFWRVVYAKHLLETGETGSITHAAQLAGISRSAIYKYRDMVFPYVREMSGKMMSIYLLLRDKPGMLSEIIAQLYQSGANILTINQNIPIDGVAVVSISVSLDASAASDMEILNSLRQHAGVVEARRLSSH